MGKHKPSYLYNIGDIVKIKQDYKYQFAIVISRNILDPEDEAYNEYAVYGQHSGLIPHAPEYALDPVHYEKQKA